MTKSRGSGRLLVIGGAETKEGENTPILSHLVEMAGGAQARILVCSAPSQIPEERARVYHAVFERLGVAEVYEAPIESRVEAEADAVVKAADRATAVLFTGGDQLRLSALVAGTRFFDAVRRRNAGERLVIAGTSAGAAAMSGTMIIGGPKEGTVRRADVDLAPGLGLWRDTVVDTHFNQRGRVHRLLAIFAQNPQILGIGIDENTALDLEPGRGFTVLGEGVVTVFDGRVSHTSAPDAAREDALAITDSVIHVLPAGYGFDLEAMRPRLPGGETVRETH